MKNTIIFLISLVLVVVGLIAHGLYYSVKLDDKPLIQYSFLIIATLFLAVPALNSWERYFKKVFNKKE